MTQTIRRDFRGKPQIVDNKSHRWNDEDEAQFLERLTATCNVKASAKAVGFSTIAIYKRRQKYPAFREAWEEALETGYARLEMALVLNATNLLEPQGTEPDLEDDALGADMTVDQALNVLRLHRAGVRGGRPQRFGWRAKPVDVEALKAEILRKIEVIETGPDCV